MVKLKQNVIDAFKQLLFGRESTESGEPYATHSINDTINCAAQSTHGASFWF